MCCAVLCCGMCAVLCAIRECCGALGRQVRVAAYTLGHCGHSTALHLVYLLSYGHDPSMISALHSCYVPAPFKSTYSLPEFTYIFHASLLNWPACLWLLLPCRSTACPWSMVSNWWASSLDTMCSKASMIQRHFYE